MFAYNIMERMHFGAHIISMKIVLCARKRTKIKL